ncbi:hypothetical protein [Curtobacterium sp. MCSS17_007]|uniref:hypothetical protein n=1 Tax=Curtobacterium sp. MCSS17_007 TaxID=2175646 RepID=UPI0011B5DE98|nr:hypothetical protein [Curtobacterium sp. MCSS17_007]WIE75198.1 hypothetical protein DEJ22_013195 [Curtobacterium sp. MCSS17_007]
MIQIRQEHQLNPVSEPVSALVAVTRPILVGLLHSIGEEYLEPHGGREGLRLKNLGRVRKASDGDLGVAFEYAVHDAVMRQEPIISDRVATALGQVSYHRDRAEVDTLRDRKVGFEAARRHQTRTNHP